jgi:hypothetical protein
MFRAASRARRPRPELGATRAPLAEVILDREIRPPIRVSGSHRSASILAVDFSSRCRNGAGQGPGGVPTGTSRRETGRCRPLPSLQSVGGGKRRAAPTSPGASVRHKKSAPGMTPGPSLMHATDPGCGSAWRQRLITIGPCGGQRRPTRALPGSEWRASLH